MANFLKNVLGIAGPIVGGIFGGPAGAAAGAAIGGGLLGGTKGGKGSATAPGGSQSQSGFATLPPEVQQAYLNQYLPAILKQFQGGGTQLAGFNPMQQQALQSFGSGLAGLQQELPQYQDLYNQNVLDPELQNIDRLQKIANNNLAGEQAGSGNLAGLYSSVYGGQLAGNNEAASNLRMNARANAFQGAQQLRYQTLQDMLNSGGAYQQQQQEQFNQPQANISQFGQNLAGFPGSQTGVQYGATPIRPDSLSQLGNIGTSLLGLGQSMGWKGFGGQQTGSAMPWLRR